MWRSVLATAPQDLHLAVEGSYYYLRVSAYAHLQEVRSGQLALIIKLNFPLPAVRSSSGPADLRGDGRAAAYKYTYYQT